MKTNSRSPKALREQKIIDVEFIEVRPITQRLRLNHTKAAILLISFTSSAICAAAAFNLLTGPAAAIALFMIIGALKLRELLKGGGHD